MSCKSCKSSGFVPPVSANDDSIVQKIIKYTAKIIGFLVGVSLIPIISLVIIWFMFDTIVLNKQVDLRHIINKYVKRVDYDDDYNDDDEEYYDDDEFTEENFTLLSVDDITTKSK
jgi:hypothetical protein